jgi:hypothetical protein
MLVIHLTASIRGHQQLQGLLKYATSAAPLAGTLRVAFLPQAQCCLVQRQWVPCVAPEHSCPHSWSPVLQCQRASLGAVQLNNGKVNLLAFFFKTAADQVTCWVLPDRQGRAGLSASWRRGRPG